MAQMDTTSIASIKVRKKHLVTTRRERWGWYFYDFGNSAYAAVILLAVYSAYFKQQVVGGAEGSRLWGVSISIATFVVAILSPILGALADFSATKKKMLFAFTAIACGFTAMLFFVQKGDVFTGMLFFILAEIGYRSGQVFYNALLPEIAKPEEMGRVSGIGWAVGSLGGIFCLLLVLALIMMIGGSFVLHTTFLITAAFYGLATAPLFLFLRERNHPSALPKGETYITASLGKLWLTFKNARQYKDFIKFLVSFLIYNNGIMITLDFAAIIGAVLFKLTQQQLIVFMIIVQITSVIGAYVFGYISQKFGSKASLVIALILMILTVSGLFVVRSLFVFNLIGAMAGFALTGVQSVSRTIVGQITPEEKSAEFYGLFSLSGQISAFLGPLVYGLVVASLTNTFVRRGLESALAEETGLRVAVTLIIAFLAVGLVLLFTIHNWQRKEEVDAE
jgi:MFS transporter, UMF1 family